MTSVGRLLRTFRIATRQSVDEAAISSNVAIDRLRELEAGLVDLGFAEGGRLAKSFMLCPPCFKRHYDSAALRDAALALEAPDPPVWPIPDDSGTPGPTVWVDEAPA